jgi:hypothetical protein
MNELANFLSQPGHPDLEDRLRADIDQLKDPAPYRRKFESQEVQQLGQAIDILWRLQREAYNDASRVGYEKLRDAKIYLDQMLREHFGLGVEL